LRTTLGHGHECLAFDSILQQLFGHLHVAFNLQKIIRSNIFFWTIIS